MAVRKKSESINFRVSPLFKAYLEGAANAAGITSTQVVEESITDFVSQFFIDKPIREIDPAFIEEDGSLQLVEAMRGAYLPGEPILTKLRTFYVADIALSSRDKIIARTILESPSYFSGRTKIFSDADWIIAEEYIPHLPAVDLDKVAKSMPSLEAFAAFREKNSKVKLSYEAFLEMTVEDQYE
ncbi:MAG: hypothetical protein KKG73_08460 [Gammaproteobacteria bacterium]|nr:hypothetical protein [Gammaproteobacteria bacterium]